MLFPLARLSNAEPRLLVEANELIISLESSADCLVHHDAAIVRVVLMVHLNVRFCVGLSAAISRPIVALSRLGRAICSIRITED